MLGLFSQAQAEHYTVRLTHLLHNGKRESIAEY